MRRFVMPDGVKRRKIRDLTVVSLTVAMTMAMAMTACRGILGIDEDTPLATTGDGATGDGGTPPNADAAGGSEGSPDGGPDSSSADAAGFDAGQKPVDRRFAVWALPPPHPLLSSYDLSADTVTDKTTTLVWQRNDATPATQSYGAGKAYCDALVLGGQSDWRLPTRVELLTILDYGQTSGYLNNTIFTDGALAGAPNIAWTDSLSLLRAKLNDRFLVEVYGGHVSISPNDQVSDLIRCVRGGPVTSPVDRYFVANGTAKDVRTGLVWQIAPSSTPKLQSDAKAACESLVLGGFSSGWRLPNVRELVSLVDESREQVPLIAPAFDSGPTNVFWTSTLRFNPQSAYFSVDFATANIEQDDFTIVTRSFRCVR